jgi:hypothetical protein
MWKSSYNWPSIWAVQSVGKHTSSFARGREGYGNDKGLTQPPGLALGQAHCTGRLNFQA